MRELLGGDVSEMKFCSDCGGWMLVDVEASNSLVKEYECLDCGSTEYIDKRGSPSVITEERAEEIGRGVSKRNEHPLGDY